MSVSPVTNSLSNNCCLPVDQPAAILSELFPYKVDMVLNYQIFNMIDGLVLARGWWSLAFMRLVFGASDATSLTAQGLCVEMCGS